MIRVTEDDDVTCPETIEKLLNLISKHEASKTGNVLLWAAMPCTGGSAWNRFNWQKGTKNTKNKIINHWKLFHRMWRSFDIVAKFVTALSGAVINEWPKTCTYWRDRRVQKMMDEYTTADFDGCMYNLRPKIKGSENRFVWKQWRISFSPNAEVFTKYFNKKCDDNNHVHLKCAGNDTKDTEKYTWEIAQAAHDAFYTFCCSKREKGKGVLLGGGQATILLET